MAGHRKPARTQRSIRDASGITYRKADLSAARAFEWAWEQRILLGYINLLVGTEGIGKGNLVAWVLARISNGELPGNLAGKPRDVAVIGDEDSWDNIWVPRMHAAGADLERALYIESGESGVLDVRDDSDSLREFIASQQLAVIYFDQLLDNLGVTDTWKDKQVRYALAPLRSVVQDLGVAMLATMHPNKRKGSFRDRLSGTPAFNAMSRSSLLVAPHPTEPDRKVVVRAKGNYSVEPPAFEFRLEERTVKPPRRGSSLITTSCIVGERESDLRADDVLDDQPKRKRDDSKVGLARIVLANMFEDGKPQPAAKVLADLERLYDIPVRIATRAATELGFRKWQDGFQGPWLWAPKEPSNPAANGGNDGSTTVTSGKRRGKPVKRQ